MLLCRMAASGSSQAPIPVGCQEGWYGPVMARSLTSASSGCQPLCAHPSAERGPCANSRGSGTQEREEPHALPILSTSWRAWAPSGAGRTGSSPQLSCPFRHCTPERPLQAGAWPLQGKLWAPRTSGCPAAKGKSNLSPCAFFLPGSVPLSPADRRAGGSQQAAGAPGGMVGFPETSVSLPLSCLTPTCPPPREAAFHHESVLASSLLASHCSLLSDAIQINMVQDMQ